MSDLQSLCFPALLCSECRFPAAYCRAILARALTPNESALGWDRPSAVPCPKARSGPEAVMCRAGYKRRVWASSDNGA